MTMNQSESLYFGNVFCEMYVNASI